MWQKWGEPEAVWGMRGPETDFCKEAERETDPEFTGQVRSHLGV